MDVRSQKAAPKKNCRLRDRFGGKKKLSLIDALKRPSTMLILGPVIIPLV